MITKINFLQCLVCAALVLIAGVNTQAQDTLHLLSGRKKIVKVKYETPSYVVYQKFKKRNPTKLGRKKQTDKQDVFKVCYLFNSELDSVAKVTQVYHVDSAMGDYFTVSEMEMFLLGKVQARKHYKAFKYALIGFDIGAGSVFLGSFWGWIPVFGYSSLAGIWMVESSLKADNQLLFNNLHFNAGYREAAKKKQAKYAIIGSTIGLVGSLIFWNTYLEK